MQFEKKTPDPFLIPIELVIIPDWAHRLAQSKAGVSSLLDIAHLLNKKQNPDTVFFLWINRNLHRFLPFDPSDFKFNRLKRQCESVETIDPSFPKLLYSKDAQYERWIQQTPIQQHRRLLLDTNPNDPDQLVVSLSVQPTEKPTDFEQDYYRGSKRSKDQGGCNEPSDRPEFVEHTDTETVSPEDAEILAFKDEERQKSEGQSTQSDPSVVLKESSSSIGWTFQWIEPDVLGFSVTENQPLSHHGMVDDLLYHLSLRFSLDQLARTRLFSQFLSQ